MADKTPSLSYKDAGVDINAGEQLVQRIKGVAKRTSRPEVLGGLGGFGALCEIPVKQRGTHMTEHAHCEHVRARHRDRETKCSE